MSILKTLLVFLGLFYSFSLFAKPNVCVFALNDDREGAEFKKFFSKNGIDVNYHAPIDKDNKQFATDAFKKFVDKMVSSNQDCDFMTLSGHHSGEYWGKNVFGRLSLKDIYKMSCNPKYSKFFNNIKGWWLLGCQTDGLNIKSAEEEAARLLRECEGSENPEYCDYSRNLITYGSLFDKDSPYLSSLQSISPKSYMFAYTKKAPLSPTSFSTFDRQFEKTGTIISQELTGAVQTSQLPSYVTNINSLVNRLLDSSMSKCYNCSEVGDEQFQNAVVKGWNDHLGDRYKPNALPPLDVSAKQCSHKNQKLLDRNVLTKLPMNELISCHHDIDCMILNQIEGLQCIKNNDPSCSSKFNKNTTKALLDIITNPKNKEAYSLFAKSFNNVESLIRELKSVSPATWNNEVKPMLQANYNSEKSVLKGYFDNKLDPPYEVKRSPDYVEVSPLRKMAIYSVEKAILDGSSEEAHANLHEEKLEQEIRSLLVNPDLKNREFNDYRQELVRSLYYYEVKDITQLDDSNLPPGVSVSNNNLKFSDPSQMLGMVEHLSTKNLPTLSERKRQEGLYNLISKVSYSDVSQLTEDQKIDYFNSFNSIYDDDLVSARNKAFLKIRDKNSVWGLRSYFNTASPEEIDKVLKSLDIGSLNSVDRSVLTTSFLNMKYGSREINSVVKSLMSQNNGHLDDASMFVALQRSHNNKDVEILGYMQKKLNTQQYKKVDMIRNFQYNLGLAPSQQFSVISKYLENTVNYDTSNDSCGLFMYYRDFYRNNYGVNTSTVSFSGC